MAYPIEVLKENYEPVVFFCNPNIYPEEEYLRRRDELIKYCEEKGFEYIIDNYEPEKWYAFVQGYEREPEKGLRCNKCIMGVMEHINIRSSQIGVENRFCGSGKEIFITSEAQRSCHRRFPQIRRTG